MQKTTLAVMAAGIGSRFGKGIKQLEPVGPSGEIIMDYSVHDALEAGFDKIVFIIRKDIEEAFRERIGRKMEQIADVVYVFQDPDDLPGGFVRPEGRTKPWGTGHAILAARDVIETPFAVINADDYYGKSAFKTLHAYLAEEHQLPEGVQDISMVAFRLGNTLSDNGGVTRGVCSLDAAGHLTGIQETKNIIRTENGAGADNGGVITALDLNAPVSMNMWGLQPSFIELLKEGFVSFLEKELSDAGSGSGEYLLPIYIDELLKAGRAQVKVLESSDTWFGVTYQEDKDSVKAAFAKLIADGVYKKNLYEQ